MSQKQVDLTSEYTATKKADDMGTVHYRVRTQNPKNTIIDVTNKSVEGMEPGIGYALGLRIENIDKKAPFDIFIDKLSNYIVRSVNNP